MTALPGKPRGKHNRYIGGGAVLGYLEGDGEKGKIPSPEKPYTSSLVSLQNKEAEAGL